MPEQVSETTGTVVEEGKEKQQQQKKPDKGQKFNLLNPSQVPWPNSCLLLIPNLLL